MKDIRNLYPQNSSIELLSKMNDCKVLQKALINFINDDIKVGLNNIRKWAVSEFDYEEEKTIDYGVEFLCERKVADVIITYLFTDYTFVVTCRHLGDHYSDIEDVSDEWISYLVSHLKGEEKEKYLAGLSEFAKRVASDIQNQFLGAGQVEEVVYK